MLLRVAPILVCILWGGNVVAVRFALEEEPAIRAAMLRSGIATLTLLVWALVRPAALRVSVRQVAPMLLLGLLITGHVALLAMAVERAAASQVVILLYLYPILTALLAHVSLPDDKLALRTSISLTLGFAGSAFTLAASRPDLRPDAIVGASLAICSACLWATHTVCTKRFLATTDLFPIVFYPTALSALALGALSAVLEPAPTGALSRSTLLALGYQGVIASGGGTLAWNMLMRRFRASILSSYTFLTPVFGVLASAVLLQEAISGRLLMGLLLVSLSLLKVERSAPRAVPSADGQGTINRSEPHRRLTRLCTWLGRRA